MTRAARWNRHLSAIACWLAIVLSPAVVMCEAPGEHTAAESIFFPCDGDAPGERDGRDGRDGPSAGPDSPRCSDSPILAGAQIKPGPAIPQLPVLFAAAPPAPPATFAAADGDAPQRLLSRAIFSTVLLI
ncbi:MAG: hypothetical protein KBD01_06745 [Acidobacteria bacterium]|nr:hypothetical protein [Acidobacteriota bacterium]